jgi:hypothetical protein
LISGLPRCFKLPDQHQPPPLTSSNLCLAHLDRGPMMPVATGLESPPFEGGGKLEKTEALTSLRQSASKLQIRRE